MEQIKLFLDEVLNKIRLVRVTFLDHMGNIISHARLVIGWKRPVSQENQSKNNLFCINSRDYFPNPIMQYVWGVLYIKTIQGIHSWDCITLQ